MSINVVVSRDGQHKCYVCFNFEKSEIYILKSKKDLAWTAKEIVVPDDNFLNLVIKEICDIPQDTDLVEFVNNLTCKKGE